MTVLGTAAVAAVVLFLSLSLLGCGSSESSVSPSGTGSPRTTGSSTRPPIDFSGVTLDGDEVSLGIYRGKPLILAFMASW